VDSAEEALQMLADGIRPQLIVILSDINIPGMDGLSLSREVKKSRPAMPVMMVTAYGDDERPRRARELGAAEFLTKPVDFDLLKEQLRRLPTAADLSIPGRSRVAAFCVALIRRSDWSKVGMGA
jgi:CheY-like chemotaxis protein